MNKKEIKSMDFKDVVELFHQEKVQTKKIKIEELKMFCHSKNITYSEESFLKYILNTSLNKKKYAKELKENIAKVQQGMACVSVCIPALLPLGRDAEIYHKLSSFEDFIDEQFELMYELNDYQIVEDFKYKSWLELEAQAQVFIDAAKDDSVMSLHAEYETALESYDEDDKSEILLHLNTKIYDAFIENIGL